ncbi:MAG: manganese catalase family protein [Selenomonadales bacterium]|nr:manganese catalase family protein [Selenomonadales bacterium]
MDPRDACERRGQGDRSAGTDPFARADYVASLGDPIGDLVANIYAEQGARVTYENLIAVCPDPCVRDALRFLWEREVVHMQRFGEALNEVQEWMGKCKRVWTGTDSPAEV